MRRARRSSYDSHDAHGRIRTESQRVVTAEILIRGGIEEHAGPTVYHVRHEGRRIGRNVLRDVVVLPGQVLPLLDVLPMGRIENAGFEPQHEVGRHRRLGSGRV